ncbi:CBS domain-containing protein [Streptomyces sp. 13-12-16]|uniref:CBS domain-containing protein n=1 Tax=Streptomyces sp. 13-12-16 TaxID=1570823 RepID=UPI002682777E|nr:CBS domain-containing protein [Streptomyces sp. 13-12-16]
MARLLDQHRISGLPVVHHDDKVLGVLPETDLIRRQAVKSAVPSARRFEGPTLRRSPRRAAAVARAKTAEALMTSPAITVHPEQRVADAARAMERRGVERLPVVDEEDRLIGIATNRDLLRVSLRTDEVIRRDVIVEVFTCAMCLPPDAVTASVRDGMVTLDERLKHRSDIPLAIQLTYRTDGVVGVVNSLAYDVDDGQATTLLRPGKQSRHVG